MGLLWGLFTGDWTQSIGVGLFFELLWLDLMPVGTYIPPNGAAAALCSLCLAQILGLHGPSQSLVAMMLGLPVGLFVTHLEYRQRKWQNASYNELLHWTRRGRHSEDESPRRLVTASLVQVFTLYFIFFCFTLFVLASMARFLDLHWTIKTLAPEVGWGTLWFAAALGGVMSLRIKRAYAVFGASVLVAALLVALS